MSKYSSYQNHQLITENWRRYLAEADRLITEQKVKDIFTEHGYTLTEGMLQEIDWKRAKKLMSRGVAGLALIGVLMGVATPAMGQAQPEEGACSETACSIETNVDQAEMKSYLAKMIQDFLGDREPSEQQLKDTQELFGWQAEWGSHADYLAPAAPAPPPPPSRQ